MVKALNTLIGTFVVALILAGTPALASAPSSPIEAMVYYTQTPSANPTTCNSAVAYDSSGSGSTQLVALSSGAPIYLCGYTIFSPSGALAQLVYGTGSNCGTGRVALTPPYQLTAHKAIVDGGDYVEGLQTAASNALCLVANYTYYRTITIDHTKVGTVNNTDQSNFPVLISGTYTQLETVANGGHVQNANGYDIIFTSDAAGTTPLNYEVESYNASTGVVNFWVKVPTVSHSSDTVIYMWYGNPSISSSQANATSVWDSNFKGIWHLNDNAGNTTVMDSTGNSNGTNSVNTNTESVTGKIGGALAYGGTVYTDAGGAVLYNFTGGTPYTIESWVYTTSNANGNVGAVSKNNIGCSEGYGLITNLSKWTHRVCAPADYVYSDSANYTTGSWQLLTAVSDGSNRYIYINGIQQSGSDTVAPTSSADVDLVFGRLYANYSSPSVAFNGYLDEIRVSSVARSSDWIKTSYNNQNSPSTFYTVGSEQQP